MPKQKRGKPKGADNHNNHESQAPAGPPGTRIVRAAALGPSLPPLVITYTSEQQSISAWLQDHVSLNNDDNRVQCVGLDTETKPCFTSEAAAASKGPDTLQLAKADGNCLVVHLSQMRGLQDLEASFRRSHHSLLHPSSEVEEPKLFGSLQGYIRLSSVLKSHCVIKSGVAIDDDALALHENKLLDVNCRFDLRAIAQAANAEQQESGQQDVKKQAAKPIQTRNANESKKSSQQQKSSKCNAVPQGLKGLSEYYVRGFTLPKQKRLQMSNWALPLSDAQVAYAAADAFAGALVVHTLVTSTKNQHTNSSILESLQNSEIDLRSIRAERQRRKKERKKESDKRRQDRKKASNQGSQAGSSGKGVRSGNLSNQNKKKAHQAMGNARALKENRKTKDLRKSTSDNTANAVEHDATPVGVVGRSKHAKNSQKRKSVSYPSDYQPLIKKFRSRL